MFSLALVSKIAIILNSVIIFVLIRLIIFSMTKLIAPWDLFKQSWQTYRRFFKIMTLVMAGPFLLFIVNPLLLQTGANALFFLPVALLCSIAASFGAVWAGATAITLLRDQDETVAFKEAFRRSWPKFWSLVWVAIISAFVVGGGILLFLAPGIIFTIFFLFAQIIVIIEGDKGMKALLKSREYTRGYFWPILGRYLLILLASMIVYGIIMSLGSALGSVSGLVSQAVANILVSPFILIYTYGLYQNLKSVKGEVPVSDKKGWIYILLAVAGYIVFALAILMMVLVFTSALSGYLIGSSVTEIMNNQVNGSSLIQ